MVPPHDELDPPIARLVRVEQVAFLHQLLHELLQIVDVHLSLVSHGQPRPLGALRDLDPKMVQSDVTTSVVWQPWKIALVNCYTRRKSAPLKESHVFSHRISIDAVLLQMCLELLGEIVPVTCIAKHDRGWNRPSISSANEPQDPVTSVEVHGVRLVDDLAFDEQRTLMRVSEPW